MQSSTVISFTKTHIVQPSRVWSCSILKPQAGDFAPNNKLADNMKNGFAGSDFVNLLATGLTYGVES